MLLLWKSKNLLDKIYLTLPLDSATELFGPFLRYHIRKDAKLHVIPDPVPGEDSHYKIFDQIFGSTTGESYTDHP